MTKQQKLSHCIGCRNNFYNGRNELGITECWSLKTMKMIKARRVPTWQRPPHEQPVEKVPDCKHEDGYSYLRGGL